MTRSVSPSIFFLLFFNSASNRYDLVVHFYNGCERIPNFICNTHQQTAFDIASILLFDSATKESASSKALFASFVDILTCLINATISRSSPAGLKP